MTQRETWIRIARGWRLRMVDEIDLVNRKRWIDGLLETCPPRVRLYSARFGLLMPQSTGQVSGVSPHERTHWPSPHLPQRAAT